MKKRIPKVGDWVSLWGWSGSFYEVSDVGVEYLYLFVRSGGKTIEVSYVIEAHDWIFHDPKPETHAIVTDFQVITPARYKELLEIEAKYKYWEGKLKRMLGEVD